MDPVVPAAPEVPVLAETKPDLGKHNDLEPTLAQLATALRDDNLPSAVGLAKRLLELVSSKAGITEEDGDAKALKRTREQNERASTYRKQAYSRELPTTPEIPAPPSHDTYFSKK